MAPCIVRDESELHVLGNETAVVVIVEYLSVCCELVETVKKVWALYNLELRLAVHEDRENVEVIVRPLCAVNDRTTLYRDASAVCLYLVVSLHCTWLHVEVNAYNVTLLPCAVDAEVTVLELALNLLAVYGDAVAETLSVSVLVEIARNNLTAYPTWDTDLIVHALALLLSTVMAMSPFHGYLVSCES